MDENRLKELIGGRAFLMALPMWQPYASLVFAKAKKFETRSKPYPLGYHNGWILIHATKALPMNKIQESAMEAAHDVFGCSWNETLPRAGLIGAVRLTGCYGTARHNADDDEKAVGDWRPGRYAWELSAATAFGCIIPFSGHQGFCKVPVAHLEALKSRLPQPAKES